MISSMLSARAGIARKSRVTAAGPARGRWAEEGPGDGRV